jgi:pimeloyl-ACP methyl ester carboxylesterase
VTKETDLTLSDGRTLHVYDTGADHARLTVFWHHGTPNTGAPPEPLFPAAAARGIRWVSHDRPGYGRSTPKPGRDVAAVAADVASIADALGIGKFAVMGHSGGGPHALACAALLPGRVAAAVSGAGTAPFAAEGLDWFAGMAPSGEAEMRAAAAGRAAYEEYLASAEFDADAFTPADQAALRVEWSWLAHIAGQAIAGGPDGMIDDELAYVTPWGFAPEQVRPPALFLCGGQDRMVPSAHSTWLARHCPAAELWLRPDDGHVSVLRSSAVAALDWLVEQVGETEAR